jgi:hypothetical protein
MAIKKVHPQQGEIHTLSLSLPNANNNQHGVNTTANPTAKGNSGPQQSQSHRSAILYSSRLSKRTRYQKNATQAIHPQSTLYAITQPTHHGSDDEPLSGLASRHAVVTFLKHNPALSSAQVHSAKCRAHGATWPAVLFEALAHTTTMVAATRTIPEARGRRSILLMQSKGFKVLKPCSLHKSVCLTLQHKITRVPNPQRVQEKRMRQIQDTTEIQFSYAPRTAS